MSKNTITVDTELHHYAIIPVYGNRNKFAVVRDQKTVKNITRSELFTVDGDMIDIEEWFNRVTSK